MSIYKNYHSINYQKIEIQLAFRDINIEKLTFL